MQIRNSVKSAFEFCLESILLIFKLAKYSCNWAGKKLVLHLSFKWGRYVFSSCKLSFEVFDFAGSRMSTLRVFIYENKIPYNCREFRSPTQTTGSRRDTYQQQQYLTVAFKNQGFQKETIPSPMPISIGKRLSLARQYVALFLVQKQTIEMTVNEVRNFLHCQISIPSHFMK